ncbi:MAG: tRNA (N6-isopentenyl adenosine(37)-C2)-methylthiotransferase MiaB [Oscillospiraceae bacterium]|nr:tRNA (N6-isopentenyl adenosine(37)-C2)-methylthiotransferase MiaB [Oscillospiraceae bacterium]
MADHNEIAIQSELESQWARCEEIRSLLSQKLDHPPLAHVHSYGCQQNVADGEKIKGLLARCGYGFTGTAGEADLILYNTCAVRENAEDRVFGNVGALKKQKKENPDLIIGLCGCMMQQEHIAQKIKQSYPYVDLVFGTHALHQLPGMLYEALSRRQRVFNTAEGDGAIVEGLPVHRDGTLKAWLPIMRGCDNFCTYCIVPYVRGREHSRRPGQVLRELEELVQQGYKEITLLGQNVNSYGKGLDEQITFAGLLREIEKIPGDFRVRFMSSHPKDCTHELIDVMAQSRKLCPYLHLPVQSGSSRVLKAMNRHYDREQYLELVRYAREKIPGITLSSDIMVGFPGETYEDFQETMSLLREVRYDFLYTFIYSSRVGTRAAQMEDPISAEEKSRWFRELLSLQEQIGDERNSAMVGKTFRVLAEGEGKSGKGYLSGKSPGNITVEFKGPEELTGQFVDVRITRSMHWAVFGERV